MHQKHDHHIQKSPIQKSPIDQQIDQILEDLNEMVKVETKKNLEDINLKIEKALDEAAEKLKKTIRKQ